MDYIKTNLIEIFSIKEIISIHYFEFARDYIFKGEKHNFWELVYVDKGEVHVIADGYGCKLKHGEMIFFKPNAFHILWANGIIAPNIFVVAFECFSPHMSNFGDKILDIGNTEKNLISQIIKEAKEAFSLPLNRSTPAILSRRNPQLPGCEQIIKNSLELLLIMLVRKGDNPNMESKISRAGKERADECTVTRAIHFLTNNIFRKIMLDEVCLYCNLNKTNLKQIFKARMGVGVIEYSKFLKIEEAKRLIRETDLNFTLISERLGYASIHHFSWHFKKTVGMTPSEYSISVR